MQTWDGSIWVTVTNANHARLISGTFATGTTTIEAISEPSTYAMLALAGAGLFFLHRRQAK